MTKTRPQRERTSWDWKPLIVIPMMVYLNVAPQADVTQRTAIDGDAGSVPEPVGATPINAAPHANRETHISRKSETTMHGGAAPIQGVNSRGEAYVLERNPKYPLLRFEMRLLQPNTIVDCRGGM